MKVIEIQKATGIDGLALATRPAPAEPGPKQVLIKMRAAALNFRDLLIVNGVYNPALRVPHVPLSDGVGDVVAVGEQVTRVKAGDRVAGTFSQNWLSGELTPEKARPTLGGDVDGVLAEYVVLHEDGLVHVPAHLTDEEAATLPCSAVTAWNALTAEGHVKAGDTVLVQGTGDVSLAAIQFAHLLGTRVIVTSSSDEKILRARKLGAAEGINYRRTPDWDEEALRLTEGAGVDYVVEVGGAGTLPKSLRAVRMGGQISLIGILAGVSAEIPILPILFKKIRVQGVMVGSRETFESMNRAIALHKLKPVVARVFPFEEAKEAFRYKQTGSDVGKVVIRF